MGDVQLLERAATEVATQKADIGVKASEPIVQRPESYRAWDAVGATD